VKWAGDLIFVNRTVNAQSLENSVKKFLDLFNGSECRRAITPLVCGLAYPPCDKSSDLTRPRHICKDYCEYVRDQACQDQWNFAMNMLMSPLNIDPLLIPDCNSLPSKNGGDSPTCVVGISNYTDLDLKTYNITTDCYDDDTDGQTYRGTTSSTVSQLECQAWRAHYPHDHSLTEFIDFDALGISSGNNYCRNPQGRGDRPWCLTIDPEIRWQYCSVPRCGGELVPASITTHPSQTLKVNVGDSIILECVATGVPLPTISWSYPSNVTGRVDTESELGLSQLTVKDAITSDAGEYLCSASNTGAIVTVKFVVEVIGE
jgi:hypothetical protein